MRRCSLARPGTKAEPRCGGGSALHVKVARWRTSSSAQNGERLQIRVEDAQTEIEALKAGEGRFAGEFVELTGPALGIVRTEDIVAVVIR